MMAERGITLSHTVILRWVQQYVPEFEKRWNNYARPVGDSLRVDETYIKVKGQWVYLYRAVDKQGRTVDFLLSKRRDVAAAKRFFILLSTSGSKRWIWMVMADDENSDFVANAAEQKVTREPPQIRSADRRQWQFAALKFLDGKAIQGP